MTTRFDRSGPSNTRAGQRYDAKHTRARRDWARAHKPTNPCNRCSHPLGPMGPHLHLDHTDDGTGYLGFSHGSTPCPDCGERCNLLAGAREGNRRSRTTEPTSRNW